MGLNEHLGDLYRTILAQAVVKVPKFQYISLFDLSHSVWYRNRQE